MNAETDVTAAPTRQIGTRSAEETHALGCTVGRRIERPLTLTITGGLGSGKTLFVQGLAVGLGVPSSRYVTSPTYTLINEYTGRLRLYHVDCYRLAYPVDVDELGLREIINTKGVVAIEWAERLAVDAIVHRLRLDFKIVDENTRRIRITGYGHAHINLLKDIPKHSEE